MNLDEDKPIVLVVDDSPDSLGMINMALDQAGYTVLVALNGRQALDIVEHIQPHAVLMDALMPVMDGFECSRNMREQLPLTPIVFMTGLTEVEHIVKAFESGGNDYITKPINPTELLARITTHVNTARMTCDARIALDVARQFVMAVDNRGRMVWATPDTQALLTSHELAAAEQTQAMQSSIHQWLDVGDTDNDLVIQNGAAPLVLRYFKKVHDNEHLLRIAGNQLLQDADALQKSLPLTKREAEVLMWVANGKTNREIGEILSLSPRTVNKHLEQIYPKIHVDNRAAATSIAIQALLGMPV